MTSSWGNCIHPALVPVCHSEYRHSTARAVQSTRNWRRFVVTTSVVCRSEYRYGAAAPLSLWGTDEVP